jgi:hypothetical protein
VKRTDRRKAGVPRVVKWRVVAEWPKQAAFQIDVSAEDEKHARRLAEEAAVSCGWIVGRPRRIQIERVNSKRRVES